MNQKSVRQRLVFPHRNCNLTVLLAVSLVFSISPVTVSKGQSQGSVDTQLAEVGGVKFLVPAEFQLEQSKSHKLSFMRSRSEPLALFVTIASDQVNEKYLADLAGYLVTQLRHRDDNFKWKILVTSQPSLSRYQTNRGVVKGLNGRTFVQLDFVVISIQNRDIVIGSIAQFGDERTATFLFDVEGREYSVQGWQALFQLIPSITGEKKE